ncbi:ankyrin repeat and SOCS box protein 13-like isoform X2 [Ostrea edulis]|uniref:ankyrin repeat and SOCS box protein 13-like isoform X2 n=1 Tax=Ostrea edulis TaxID=37623 RepID=UPI0024AEAE0C|nr:ankyrin repeat and SOCS box protein 13-like isoform X2 [Ostrea edulis]
MMLSTCGKNKERTRIIKPHTYVPMVNVRNIDGATPLCDAASSGHVDIVKLLLERGAYVNPPLLLSSPLHEATLRDKWETVEVLAMAGANLNSSDCHFGTPLHVAACQGSVNCAQSLLQAGACVNSIKSLNTPLHEAARRQDMAFILLLLMYGADPTARNNNGLRPIDLVSSSTHPAKQVLLQWESNPRDLRHCCRLVIRRYLGTGRLKFIKELPVPKLLHQYLDFRCNF